MKTIILSFTSALIGGLMVLFAVTDYGSATISSLKRTFRSPIQECVDYANKSILFSEFKIRGEGRLLEVLEKGKGYRLISVSLPDEDFGYFVRCNVSEGAGLFSWPLFSSAYRLRF